MSIMFLPKFVNMTKNTPFFPILHVFAPLNDVHAYIVWSWKTTLIMWIFLRGWYLTSNTSGRPWSTHFGRKLFYTLSRVIFLDTCTTITSRRVKTIVIKLEIKQKKYEVFHYLKLPSANGHCTASQYSARSATWTAVYTNQPKISSQIFCFWMHENCSKLCSGILTFVSHYPVLQNVNILLEGTFSLEKRKSKWPTVK